MLFINDEKLDLSNTDKNYKYAKEVSYYRRKCEELKRLKSPVILLTEKKPVINPYRNLQEPRKQVSYPYKTYSYNSSDGATKEWRYCPVMPMKGRNGLLYYDPDHRIMKTQWSFSLPKDIEELFFWIYLSPHVGSSLYIDKPNLRGGIRLEDKEYEAKKTTERKSAIANVDFYIYSPMSPLSKDEEKLRMLAKAYNIQKVDDMGINQVKVALEEKIMFNERNKFKGGIDDFMTDIQGITPLLKLQAMIQEGIDKGLIYFDIKKGKWFYNDKDSIDPRIVMTVSPNKVGQPEEALLEYYKHNVKEVQDLEAILSTEQRAESGEGMNYLTQKSEENEANRKVVEKQLAELGWADLKTKCKEKGITVRPGKNRAALIEEYLGK